MDVAQTMAEMAEMLSIEMDSAMIAVCSRICEREEIACDALIMIVKNLQSEIEDCL